MGQFSDSESLGVYLCAPMIRGAREGDRIYLCYGSGSVVSSQNPEGEVEEVTVRAQRSEAGLSSARPDMEKVKQGVIRGSVHGKGKLTAALSDCMNMGIYNPLFDGGKLAKANKGLVITNFEERKRRRADHIS